VRRKERGLDGRSGSLTVRAGGQRQSRYRRRGGRFIVFAAIMMMLAGSFQFFAGLIALANFLFLPYYPFWALTVITLDVLVIWAVTAHGRDLQNASM
jgi:hypothetical protein